ncbi:uncharacterized protein G2W53_026584 [Senna tora]|uniref:Uncharacterized protein n=1 Tax=Senna tora TaxID=362788 RepID=A0A834TPB8_9FABA|nr:uncharacterized protein G2W53_026584 [Senna tora]
MSSLLCVAVKIHNAGASLHRQLTLSSSSVGLSLLAFAGILVSILHGIRVQSHLAPSSTCHLRHLPPRFATVSWPRRDKEVENEPEIVRSRKMSVKKEEEGKKLLVNNYLEVWVLICDLLPNISNTKIKIFSIPKFIDNE